MIEIEKRKNELISILKVLKNIVSETNITFNKEGLFIKAIYPSNTCMILVNISTSLFEKYLFEKEQTYTLDMEQFSLLLENLNNGVLKITPSEDVLMLEDDKHDFEINYFVGSRDTREKPTFEEENKITITSEEFFNNINKLTNFNSIGKFSISKNIFTIYSKSHLIKGKIKLDCIVNKCDENYVYYDIELINKIKEIKNLFENINIEFGSNTPLILKGENDCIKFEFILASRIE